MDFSSILFLSTACRAVIFGADVGSFPLAVSLADVPSSSTGLWVLSVAILSSLVWLTTTLFAFWRVGRLSQSIRSAQNKTQLLEQVLKGDARRPIWLWPDGRCQADGAAMALLETSVVLTSIDDLLAILRSGQVQRNGIAISHQGLESVIEPDDDPDALTIFVPKNTSSRIEKSEKAESGLLITVQSLPGLGSQFPDRVLWLAPLSTKAAEISVLQADIRSHESHAGKLLMGADYRTAYKNLPLPAAVFEKGGRLIDANLAYMTAVEADTVDKVITRQIQLAEKAPTSSLEKIFAGQTTARERQFGLIRRDRRHLLLSAQRLSDTKAIVVYSDVSGEEEAQVEITRLLDSQTETLNRLRTPVAIFGSDKMLRFFNAAFCRISKLDPEWLKGNVEHSDVLDAMRANRRVPELIDYQSWKSRHLEAYTGLLEAEEEMWHLSNGSTYRVVTQPYPFGGILILFEDITDKLVLERKYNTLIAVQRETLNNLEDAVAVFAEDTTLRLANRAFNKLWQLPEGLTDEQPPFRALTPSISALKPSFFDDQGNAFDYSNRLPSLIANADSFQGSLVLEDDRYFDFALTNLPDGRALFVLSDRSESRRAAQALTERNAALETADRMRSAFITSISYELRTPLNAISGFAELMRLGISGELNDKQEAYLDDILSAADDLKKMISDVLDLAVLQSGQLVLEPGIINSEELLEDTISIAADLCIQSGITLRSKVGPAGDLEIDGRRIKQAILNMTSSAISLTSRGDALDLYAAVNNATFSITISIPVAASTPESRQELLNSLQAGAAPEKRRATGIDLALARSIIELHKGTISIEPIEKLGLSISATLPMDAAK